MGAQGTTSLNFGSFPGAPEASVDVTGQSGYTSSSLAEAWVVPVATAEHSADEHLIEGLKVMAYFKTNGTFTIRGEVVTVPQKDSINNVGAQRLNLYGNFTIGWVWN